MFVKKARAYPSKPPFRCFIHSCIRLGWKGMSGVNTLAYYDKLVNYDNKKSFITFGPGQPGKEGPPGFPGLKGDR